MVVKHTLTRRLPCLAADSISCLSVMLLTECLPVTIVVAVSVVVVNC